MVTNTTKQDMDAAAVLDAYKYQPFLEKRNEQLKSVLSVAPIYLQNPKRVAALLFVYFLAVLVFALIEREARLNMKKRGSKPPTCSTAARRRSSTAPIRNSAVRTRRWSKPAP